MGIDLSGREVERGQIRDFLVAGSGGLQVLVLEGETGIGKTALWTAGVESARRSGSRVLAARPAEPEQGLALSALGDLLDDGLEDLLPRLAAPRRRAIAVALLRDGPEAPLDHRALAVGVRDVLQLLAEDGQVVVAIDDVQWLDAASSAALAFALRRLTSQPIKVLLSRRPTEGARGSPLYDVRQDAQITRCSLQGLSVGALHRMLRDRLGRPFPHQTLLRIHQRSGGNPFFALELGRAVDADSDVGAQLTVPWTLEKLLRARLVGLPDETREALAIASAVGAAPMAFFERTGVEAAALEPALSAHVVERRDGVVRFTHPLLSSVLYGDLGEARQRIHARIAQSVDDPVERARHFALSADAPDLAMVGLLDDAIRAAGERGAPAVVAELAEHAVRLTPTDDDKGRRRRALIGARAHQEAGEWTRARSIAAGLLQEPGIGSDRAEALLLQAELESVTRSAELLEEALEVAGPRSRLRVEIESRLAWAQRLGAGLDHARAAVVLAEQIGDDLVLARARAVEAVMSWFLGARPAPPELLDIVQHLPDALGSHRLVQEGMLSVVNTFAPAPERPRVLGFLDRERRRWSELDEPRSARALWSLSWMEFWAGRWTVAGAHATQALDIATQYGLEVPQDHLPIAVIAVHRGDLEAARRHSSRALALAGEQFRAPPPQHLAVVGLASLWEGDRNEALTWLSRADRTAGELGWGEPSVRWWTGDLVELLLGLGRVEEAQRLVEVWDADAIRVSRPWVSAHVARCRGLVAAATGDVDQALTWFDRAVTLHDEVGDPFGRARALLALGVARRRERQKNPARAAIEEALSGFVEVGAMQWATTARSELGHIGGRQRVDGLTAAEARVADLVAGGRTNREVAATLFLGERTVASHLTHVYAKLGIRSRTELAHLMRRDADTATGSSMSVGSDDSSVPLES